MMDAGERRRNMMGKLRYSLAAALATIWLLFPVWSMAQEGQYVGQMRTTFQTSNIYGAGQTLQTTVNVLVSVQRPYQIPAQYAQQQGTVDKNPFFLYVTQFDGTQIQAGQAFTPGGLQIVSATPQVSKPSDINTPSGGRWILDHWALATDGTNFKGEYLQPLSVDVNNFFVSQEIGGPLAWNPGALANGGNPFDTSAPVSCVAFLKKPVTLSGTFDHANGRIQMVIDGHGGGYMTGMCVEDLAFRAEVVATYDPAIPAPTPQIAP